jgi:hypothetical protein
MREPSCTRDNEGVRSPQACVADKGDKKERKITKPPQNANRIW